MSAEVPGPVNHAQCACLPVWRGDVTSACVVDAVCGEMYIPAKSASDSKPVLNVRTGAGRALDIDAPLERAAVHEATTLAAHSATIAFLDRAPDAESLSRRERTLRAQSTAFQAPDVAED